MKYIISLELEGKPSIERFAQNRSKTFDGSLTVVKHAEAKRFDTTKQARGWLKRNNLFNLPSPFCRWEIHNERNEKI